MNLITQVLKSIFNQINLKQIKKMKKLIFLFFYLSITSFSYSQESIITIKTTGSSITKEKAIQISLRSAVEQSFGAFISSNTEVFNDELIADEISSVSSGNIEKYEILSEDFNESTNSWFVTTSVQVSIGKLTKFVESKGVEVKMKGSLFSLNIKQKELNSSAEYKSILDMLKPFHESMINSYDYQLEVSQPVSNNENVKGWKVDLNISAETNKNFIGSFNILKNTLSSLSLTTEELIEYKKLNKDFFPVYIDSSYSSSVNDVMKGKKYSGVFTKGTLVNDISKELNISVEKLLTANDLNLSNYGNISLNNLKVNGRSSEMKITKDINKNYFYRLEEPKPIYFLRNRKSILVLKYIVEHYLSSLYGSNYDIISDVHNFYSFPEIKVTTDSNLLEIQGHSLKIEKQNSLINFSESYNSKHGFNPENLYSLNSENGKKNLQNLILLSTPNFEGIITNEKDISGYQEIFRYAAWEDDDWNKKKSIFKNDILYIRFENQKNYLMNDKLSLEEIERLNGYKVEVNHNSLNFSNGGISFNHGKKKVVIPIDPLIPDFKRRRSESENLGFFDQNSYCDLLKEGGFSDWKLPSSEDVLFISLHYGNLLNLVVESESSIKEARGNYIYTNSKISDVFKDRFDPNNRKVEEIMRDPQNIFKNYLLVDEFIDYRGYLNFHNGVDISLQNFSIKYKITKYNRLGFDFGEEGTKKNPFKFCLCTRIIQNDKK